MIRFFTLILTLPLFSELIVTGRIDGGMGNQMFLAATVYAYALDIGAEAIFPQIPVAHVGESPVLSRLKRSKGSFSGLPLIEEVWFRFVHLPLDSPRSVCLMGFFQSAQYFNHRKKEIRELFAPLPAIKDNLIKKHGSLLEKETVAIHVRRGDYLHFCGENGIPIMYNLSEDNEYYEKALSHFDRKNHWFLVFSDEIEFAKKMVVFQTLEHVFYVEGQPHYDDFYLMSFCKHHILSNSTFSWWAAYLCENPNQRVIFPMKWFGPGLPPYIGPQEPGGYCKANAYTPLDHWIKIE